MHISAKVDYAMRALVTLVADDTPRTAEELAASQDLPPRFLGSILGDLRRAGILASQRGSEGGYRFDRDPATVTVADVMRVLDGPLAEVRGERPEDAAYGGAASHLQEVWVAVRAGLRGVLENVTLAQVASGNLPRQIRKLTADPDAWERRI